MGDVGGAPDIYYDDLTIGDTFETEPATVSEDEIVGFAKQYDPQSYHIDHEAAAATEFGGLIASGFHMLAASFGLFFHSRVLEKHNLGSPGMDEVRWLRPLRPGDTIHGVAEVIDMQPSRSKADRGSIWMRHDTVNQHGEVIMSAVCIHRLRRRPPNEST
jgi:acyl dehydratase